MNGLILIVYEAKLLKNGHDKGIPGLELAPTY